MSDDELSRFWSKVDVQEEGCWLWQGSLCIPQGYGRIFTHERKYRRAHIISYELFHGPVDAGLLVCHTCDNRRCVRPSHLYAGTSKQNTADMNLRGRNGRAIFTAEEYEIIRADYQAGGTSYRKLAVKYQASPATIRDIIKGRTKAARLTPLRPQVFGD